MKHGRKRCKVDLPAFFRLWHDASLRIEEVALQLKISTGTLRKIAAQHGLTQRATPPLLLEFTDAPSDAEDLLSQDSLALSPWVEARAREVRERHFAQRRGECDSTSRSRCWRSA